MKLNRRRDRQRRVKERKRTSPDRWLMCREAATTTTSRKPNADRHRGRGKARARARARERERTQIV